MGPMSGGNGASRALRQFHQIDAEASASRVRSRRRNDPAVRAVAAAAGLTRLKLLVNSLGTPAARAAYRDELAAYSARTRRNWTPTAAAARSNPLRILDSKNPQMQHLVAGAPRLLDSLDPESKEHFEPVRAPQERGHRVSCRAASGARGSTTTLEPSSNGPPMLWGPRARMRRRAL